MTKVKSNPTINLLTIKFVKNNKRRNIIAILAIIMTTVMFTSLFTALLSMIKSNLNMNIRESMTTCHTSIQDLTKEQFEKIRNDKTIDLYGYNIFMTLAENKQLRASSVEIRYADENAAKGYMSFPTKGRMPEKENEIALSTITLNLLEIPHELGTKVPIECILNGKKVSKEFVLSGYWKGDPVFMSQLAWVSEEFCLKNSKKALEETIEEGDYEGSYNLSIWYDNLWGLQEKTDYLDKTYKISDSQAKISVSYAYDLLIGEDGFPINIVFIVLIIIFIAGYLIIFNVFYISVQRDIRQYALLKNIGTTGRQLRKIVRGQALFLSIIGIPIGMVIGYIAGGKMTPMLVENNVQLEGNVLVTANPFVFIVSALFSLITIYIACMKPCRIVGKLSATEAIGISEVSGEKKHKPTRNVTPFFMALSNLRRIWKKAAIVICSLMLPVMILNAVYMIQKGFNVQEFVDTYISADFHVSGCTHNFKTSDLAAITPDIGTLLEKQKYVKSVNYVYDTETHHKLNKKEYKMLCSILDKLKKENVLDKKMLKKEEEYVEGKNVVSHILGIDEMSFQKMEYQTEKTTWKKFVSGKYVIVGALSDVLGFPYQIGDKVKLEFGNGKSKTYTVLTFGELPYDMRYPFGSGTYLDYTFYLPKDEYIAQTGNENARAAYIKVKDGKKQEFYKWIKDYTANHAPFLYFESSIELEKEAKGFAEKYYYTLVLLGGIIFVIGVLNFFNTSAVSILGRKRELSLLEAVGMTKKQIRKMLMYEGMFYLLTAFFIANTIGITFVKKIIDNTVGKAFYYTYQFDLTASIVILPILIGIAVFIPLYNYHKMCSETVVERIRMEE